MEKWAEFLADLIVILLLCTPVALLFIFEFVSKKPCSNCHNRYAKSELKENGGKCTFCKTIEEEIASAQKWQKIKEEEKKLKEEQARIEEEKKTEQEFEDLSDMMEEIRGNMNRV